MITYNSILDNFSVSADYVIDKNCHIGEVFDNIQYDGELTMLGLLDSGNGLTKFNTGDLTFIQYQEIFNILDVSYCNNSTNNKNEEIYCQITKWHYL